MCSISSIRTRRSSAVRYAAMKDPASLVSALTPPSVSMSKLSSARPLIGTSDSIARRHLAAVLFAANPARNRSSRGLALGGT